MDTPVYIFDAKEIRRCYDQMRLNLKSAIVHYALKANSDMQVLSILRECGASFEVASEIEFKKLISLAVSPDRIICGLPVKPIEWLKSMSDSGCSYFVFDTVAELDKIQNIAPNSKKILRLYINDVVPNSIEFGMQFNDAMHLICQSDHSSLIDGVSFHISNNTEFSLVDRALDRATLLIEQLQYPQLLNIGGGYRLTAANDFYMQLNSKLSSLKTKYKVEVIAEPGNAIVNTAGVLRTTVIGVRERSSYQYDVYIDAGKPTGFKTDFKRIPAYVRIVTNHLLCEPRLYRFIDITCMHRPHFQQILDLEIIEGTILEFGDMGAYTVCLANNFHAWAPPKTLII